MSESKKGIPKTDEHKRKLSDALQGYSQPKEVIDKKY